MKKEPKCKYDASKTGDQSLLLREGHGEIWRHNLQNAQALLEEDMSDTPSLEDHWLIWVNKTGE